MSQYLYELGERVAKNILIIIIFFSCSLFAYKDLTLLGPLKFDDGLGRVGLGVIDSLKGSVKIQTDPCGILGTDLSSQNNFITSGLERSGVCIVTDPLFRFDTKENRKKLRKAKIKIAYSMLECSAIPQKWTKILNSLFDAVLVPDEYLQKVYAASGVKIPIFVMPCPSYLNKFIRKPIHKASHTPFVFMSSGTFIDRKNHYLIVKAFRELFGNRKDIKLVLHGRAVPWDNQHILDKIYQEIETYNLKNVEIVRDTLSWDRYVNLMASSDCYIFISKGEGFSFTPLEACALGIPCILSKNTVHISKCKSGLFIPVPASIKARVEYPFYSPTLEEASFFDCKIEDVKKAMLDVYEHYELYAKDCEKRREWSKQFLPQSLSKKFYNLVKPAKVIFSKGNIVTESYICTNDRKLYAKYMQLNNKSKIL